MFVISVPRFRSSIFMAGPEGVADVLSLPGRDQRSVIVTAVIQSLKAMAATRAGPRIGGRGVLWAFS
jgi:hypothetical protein